MKEAAAPSDRATAPDAQTASYYAWLQRLVGQCCMEMERLFGPRSPRYRLEDVYLMPSEPSSWHWSYVTGGAAADTEELTVRINLSGNIWESRSYEYGLLLIAHECVHLLDPNLEQGDGWTLTLEEGLAEWFALYVMAANDVRARHIAPLRSLPPDYRFALDLVRHCMPGLTAAVRALRAAGTPLHAFTPDALRSYLPDAPRRVLHDLCQPFYSIDVPWSMQEG